jgi:hypothetical protein
VLPELIRQRSTAIDSVTVEQLIKELQKYPPKMRVIVDGYEGGYSDPKPPEVTQIQLNVHNEDECYFGRHDDPDPSIGGKFGGVIEAALLLPR